MANMGVMDFGLLHTPTGALQEQRLWRTVRSGLASHVSRFQAAFSKIEKIATFFAVAKLDVERVEAALIPVALRARAL